MKRSSGEGSDPPLKKIPHPSIRLLEQKAGCSEGAAIDAFGSAARTYGSPHTHQTMEPVSGYSWGKPDAPDTAFIVKE
jgi:hypothetical protein